MYRVLAFERDTKEVELYDDRALRFLGLTWDTDYWLQHYKQPFPDLGSYLVDSGVWGVGGCASYVPAEAGAAIRELYNSEYSIEERGYIDTGYLTPCLHEWVSVQGFLSVYTDCIKCGAKKEKLNS